MPDGKSTPREIVGNLLSAMKRSKDEGCTDHLDCCDDGGAFWYGAIEEAEKLLAAPEPENDAELSALAAHQCHDGYGDEYGNHRCKYQDRIKQLEDFIRENLPGRIDEMMREIK